MVTKSQIGVTKISKLEMNQNAVKFKANIEEEIQKTDKASGARYECIFKNLLRDIRQYYSTKFENFLKQIYTLDSYNKNLRFKYQLFPYQLIQFVIQIFDVNLIDDTNFGNLPEAGE